MILCPTILNPMILNCAWHLSHVSLSLCSGSIFSYWAARGDCTCLCPQCPECRACVPVSRPPANTPGTQGGEREESQPIYILQRYTATKHRPGTFHNQTANIRSSNMTKVRLPPRFIPLFLPDSLAVYLSTLMSISCYRGWIPGIVGKWGFKEGSGLDNTLIIPDHCYWLSRWSERPVMFRSELAAVTLSHCPDLDPPSMRFFEYSCRWTIEIFP